MHTSMFNITVLYIIKIRVIRIYDIFMMKMIIMMIQ